MFDRLFPDEKAAIAAFLANNTIKRPVVKASPKVVRNGPVVMSRVAARPAAVRMTQGFTFKSLSDTVTRR